MRCHCEGRGPAAAVGAGDRGNHDDGTVRGVFGRGVGIAPLGRGFLHSSGGVLEREESRHGVCFECVEEVARAGSGYAWGAEEAGGGGPDVEAAPGVEHVVDEGEGVFFRVDFVRVADDFGVRVLGVDGFGELGVGFGGGGGACVDACCAVGWKLLELRLYVE